MKRREFISMLSSAAAILPLAARAQPATRMMGFLDGQTFDPYLMTAFRQALKETGYIEGKNVEIYFRSADGQTDRLVTLARDIVGRLVIVTTGGGGAALAAHASTTTIPIVFVSGVDPVTSGLSRPRGNATGVLAHHHEQRIRARKAAAVPNHALSAIPVRPEAKGARC